MTLCHLVLCVCLPLSGINLTMMSGTLLHSPHTPTGTGWVWGWWIMVLVRPWALICCHMESLTICWSGLPGVVAVQLLNKSKTKDITQKHEFFFQSDYCEGATIVKGLPPWTMKAHSTQWTTLQWHICWVSPIQLPLFPNNGWNWKARQSMQYR